MWIVKFIPEAKDELDSLDGSLIKQVLTGIKKVSQNPLSSSEGGYGHPLGNVDNNNLTGFFKIKYRGIGIRVVYSLVKDEDVMNIIVVSKREDSKCYDLADKRKDSYGDDLFKNKF